MSVVAGLRAGLHLTDDQLQARQLERLRCVIGHAYERVVYYRRLFDSVGFQPRHLKNISDLDRVPVTTRRALQETAHADLVARGFAAEKLRLIRTSGATGAPLAVHRRPLESRVRLLLTLRSFRHHGLKWSDRVLTISRQPSTTSGAGRFICWPGLRRWNLSIFELPEKQLQMFLKIRPAIVYGYAPSVALLGSLLSKRGTGAPWLRVVATSAEMLIPQYRKMIRNGFGLEPVDIYNCTELGDVAWQCRLKSGFHINADWLIAEAIRREDCLTPADIGELAVTSLYHYAMPLIRYSPGDLGTLAKVPCRCGIGLPLLDRLEGRAQTLAPLPDGRYFLGFSRIMSDFPEVGRYQIVQRKLDSFVVSVVPCTFWSQELSKRVAAALASKMGPDIQLEVIPVAETQLIQGPGKFRPVIPLTPRDGSAPQ